MAPNLGCQQQENAKVRCATSKGNAAVVGATNLGIYKRGTSVQLTEQTYWTNAFCASLCAHLSRREKQQQTSSITNMNLEGSNLLSTHFTPKSYSKWEWIYLTRCLEEWTWGSQCDAAAAWKRIMLQPVVWVGYSWKFTSNNCNIAMRRTVFTKGSTGYRALKKSF